jgi:SAM-dependent methyltransferase
MKVANWLKSKMKSLLRSFGYEIIPTKAVLPRAVREDFDPILDKMGRYRFKFLDVNHFLVMTLVRAHKLGLHETKSLDVLDIGTGPGYFPFVCQHYGHRAIAIDRQGNDVFEAVPVWLGVDRRFWEINPYQPLPSFERRFDLITGFMVNFDRFADRDCVPWNPAEWDYFLADLTQNHLKPTGRVAFLLNGHTLGHRETMNYLREAGARIENGWVLFDKAPRVGFAKTQPQLTS